MIVEAVHEAHDRKCPEAAPDQVEAAQEYPEEVRGVPEAQEYPEEVARDPAQGAAGRPDRAEVDADKE
jgi:hypothetical protein